MSDQPIPGNRKSMSGLGRRTFLKAGLLAGGAVLFAPSVLRAQGKHVRKSMMSPDAAPDLKSYADAVSAMLKLPPDDPRNWYRIAMIHMIDCPHGSWWFTSWHRGYLGYFEQICRDLSGNPDFALPYWDWTAYPLAPPAMFGTDNPLDPVNSPLYIADTATFDATLRPRVEALWKAMSPAQQLEQAKRMNYDFDIFWKDPNNGVLPAFQQRANARFLTAANPNLDANARGLVNLDAIRLALTPTSFVQAGGGVAFENGIASSHQDQIGQYSMLSRAHNFVHMSVGGSDNGKGSYQPPFGLMSQNLSPCDPIFFLHHCNIDRLWDVWTRKQQKLGLPTGPVGDVINQLYRPEPYLFFVDAGGNPVTGKTTAWDYFEIGEFDYSYQPGSGEDIVDTPPPLTSERLLLATGPMAMAGHGAMTEASPAAMSPENLRSAVQQPNTESAQFAEVSFTAPANAFGKVFSLFVAGSADAPADQRELAGTFTFFGHAGHGATTTFTTPISAALDLLDEKGGIAADKAPVFTLETSDSETGAAQLNSVRVFGLSTS